MVTICLGKNTAYQKARNLKVTSHHPLRSGHADFFKVGGGGAGGREPGRIGGERGTGDGRGKDGRREF